MLFNSHDPKGQVRAESLFQSRQDSYFQRYFAWLDETRPTSQAARVISITARSPASPVMLALQASAEDLQSRNVFVRAVLSDVDPEKALHSAWQVMSMLAPNREHVDMVRWANAPAILEAHEQMIMGDRMCWLGDAMRREPGRRDAFDIFEADAQRTCSLALNSYTAMWRHARPVPKWLLQNSGGRKQGASFAGPEPRALATLSFFRQLSKSDTLCH
ncbi:MAG: hypothetical protein MPJ78_05310 [Hyphomicrobiaceae bacterium]|nr:hypothetical protein [Hyphomicrobiaceae bacterium]